MVTKRTGLIVLYAVALVFGAWTVHLYNNDVVRLDSLTTEDGVVEYLQAGCFLLAAVVFLALWVRSRFRNLVLLGFGLLLFVVGGEEISWGQRIFGVDTPESLAGVNVQGETNLHNIDGVHQSVRAVALLFILGVTVAIPLAARFVPWVRELHQRWGIPIVPLWTLPITAIGVLFMAVPRLTGEVVFSLDEVGELYVAATFLLFAVASAATPAALVRRRRRSAPQREATSLTALASH